MAAEAFPVHSMIELIKTLNATTLLMAKVVFCTLSMCVQLILFATISFFPIRHCLFSFGPFHLTAAYIIFVNTVVAGHSCPAQLSVIHKSGKG